MSGTNVMQRLRAAGLRPTSARIGVLQVIDAAGETPLPAEEVFRRMSVRGTRVSLGTVYRLIHELETRQVLLRGWGSDRKALYWLRRTERGALGLQLVCQRTGRRVVLDDADLGRAPARRGGARRLRPGRARARSAAQPRRHGPLLQRLACRRGQCCAHLKEEAARRPCCRRAAAARRAFACAAQVLRRKLYLLARIKNSCCVPCHTAPALA